MIEVFSEEHKLQRHYYDVRAALTWLGMDQLRMERDEAADWLSAFPSSLVLSQLAWINAEIARRCCNGN